MFQCLISVFKDTKSQSCIPSSAFGILSEIRLNPCEIRLKQFWKLGKLKISIWWKGLLLAIFNQLYCWQPF